jgi:hypothetical protein
MANKVLFISSTYVKQFTQIQNNVSDDKINLSIEQAQTKYVLPALGRTLYNFLVTSIDQNNGLGALQPDYIELIQDYITPMLTEYTLYESTLMIAFQFSNKNVGRHNDQFLGSTPLDELKYLRAELLNNAQWYGKRLQKYLEFNKDKFPEYSVESFDLNPSKDAGSFNSGMVFDKKRSNRLIKTYSEENPYDGRIINS